MKLAVFTPLPPTPSGIADYSALLLDTLVARGVDVEAHVAEPSATSTGGAYPVKAVSELDGDRTALFHVGNSEHHDFLYPALFERPCVLVLHDLVLHHARLGSYLKSPEVLAYQEDLGNLKKRDVALATIDGYRREVRKAYPDDGDDIAEIAVRMGGGRLLYAYPLFEHLVRASKLTLVHGTSARDEVKERVPEARVERVRMGVRAPEPVSREEARRKLGLGEGLVLASFGLVTPEKRIGTALRALARLRAQGVDARYLLVGGTVDHYDALADAASVGVADAVEVTGRLPDETFWLHAFAADICLNLRYPSAGETSATLLGLLACGRAVMVTDQMHVSDFGDDVVARTSLEGSEHGLYCDLMDLVRAEPRRRRLERQSRELILREHSAEAMADDYLNALSAAGI